MNKRKIESLRRVAKMEVAKPEVAKMEVAKPEIANVSRMASSGPAADADRVKGVLERFYAARLASKDFERSMFGTPQKLALTALDEAVDATKVWEKEVDKATAKIMEEIWK